MVSSHSMTIVFCKAKVVANHGLFFYQIYSFIQSSKKALGNAVLSVMPEAFLIITKNLNHLLVPLLNGAIVELYGFCESTN